MTRNNERGKIAYKYCIFNDNVDDIVVYSSTSIQGLEKASTVLEYNPGNLIILRTVTKKLFSSPLSHKRLNSSRRCLCHKKIMESANWPVSKPYKEIQQ